MISPLVTLLYIVAQVMDVYNELLHTQWHNLFHTLPKLICVTMKTATYQCTTIIWNYHYTYILHIGKDQTLVFNCSNTDITTHLSWPHMTSLSSCPNLSLGPFSPKFSINSLREGKRLVEHWAVLMQRAHTLHQMVLNLYKDSRPHGPQLSTSSISGISQVSVTSA